MKDLKPPFANFRSFALVLVLAGLILVSAFVATMTVLLTGTPLESPRQPRIDASSGSTSGSPSEAGISSGGPTVNSKPNVIVWVNTNSGIYHCPNTRWYGNTKNGEYMTQQEAQAKGYRPAHGNLCG